MKRLILNNVKKLMLIILTAILLLSTISFEVFASDPKVSIIIPVYNTPENLLRDCLESAKNQTLKDIEIICIDDGSTNGSGKILDEYAKSDPRFVVVHQENSGVAVARDKGMDLAKGEYIQFLDSDDTIVPSASEKCYNAAKEYDTDVVKFLLPWEEDFGDDIETITPDSSLHKNCYDLVWNGIYRREFLKINKLRFRGFKSGAGEDTMFSVLCCMMSNKIVILPEKLLDYHSYNPISISKVLKNKRIDLCSYNVKYFFQMVKKYNLKINKGMCLGACLGVVNWCKETGENIEPVIKAIDPELLRDDVINQLPPAEKIQLKSIIKHVNSRQAKPQEGGENPRVKNLNCIEEFKDYNVRPNSVLIVERYPCHHECIQGYAKYFLDLGFKVDILLRARHEDSVKGLVDSKYADRICVFALDNFFSLDTVAEKSNSYKHILMNTADNYYKPIGKNIKQLDNIFFVFHSNMRVLLQKFQKELSDNKIITLGNFRNGKMVNPHYFGDIPVHVKNKLTRFVVVGGIKNQKRDYSLLPDSIKKLNVLNKDFEVVVVGSGSGLKIVDPEISKHLKFKGKLSYADMYEELKNSDFILALLNPYMQQHRGYLTDRVSGTFQLAYGFHKILLIDKTFAYGYGLNKENSIIYDNNELDKAMLQAINMVQLEYDKKQHQFSDLAAQIYDKSLKNLKDMCDFQDKRIKISKNITKNRFITNSKRAEYQKDTIKEYKTIDDGIYTISSKLDPNYCLTIKDGSKNNCANLQLLGKNGTDAQKFKVQYNSDGCYTIKAMCSGKILDVLGGSKNILQCTKNKRNSQKWFIVPDGEGFCCLVSKSNDSCMEVCGAEAKQGANIRCWSIHAGDNQRFKLEKCEDKPDNLKKSA